MKKQNKLIKTLTKHKKESRKKQNNTKYEKKINSISVILKYH